MLQPLWCRRKAPGRVLAHDESSSSKNQCDKHLGTYQGATLEHMGKSIDFSCPQRKDDGNEIISRRSASTAGKRGSIRHIELLLEGAEGSILDETMLCEKAKTQLAVPRRWAMHSHCHSHSIRVTLSI